MARPAAARAHAQAETLIDQSQWEQAQKVLDRAVEVLSHDLAAVGASKRLREVLTEALWERARVLRTLDHKAEAEKLDRERESLWKDQPPADLAALALGEVARAAVVDYGKAPARRLANSPLDRDLARAAANLNLAISLGFKSLATVKSHPDFLLLQSRDDFKPLIKELEKQRDKCAMNCRLIREAFFRPNRQRCSRLLRWTSFPTSSPMIGSYL